MTNNKPVDQLKVFLLKSQQAFMVAFLFSFFINVLMLAMSLYSLQVLDRVLSSNSMETLLMLSIIMVVIFIIIALLQVVRSFIFLHISNWMDQKLSGVLLEISLSIKQSSNGSQHLRDLATLKSFVTGQVIVHLFDAPWAILYLAVIFFIHPINGWITLGGAVLLLVLAWFNDRYTKQQLKKANESQVVVMREVDSLTRNAEVIGAMGMSKDIVSKWQLLNKELTDTSSKASVRSSSISAVTRGVRMTLQMLTMASGAILVIKNQMSPGGIIATSILSGKALAPFDAAVTIWKSLVGVKKSYSRLSKSMSEWKDDPPLMSLPEPKGDVAIEKCVYALPGTDQLIIKGVNISIKAGESIGIIGSTGSGKTTLARLIAGVLQPTKGLIRIDGASIQSWDQSLLGQHFGYLPQDIELFSGTVEDNIARMKLNTDSKHVLDAAMFTETHNMIVQFKDGYNTKVGDAGQYLSGGQRQRLALARAFYGMPKVVVLDEPNSNLDTVGEDALYQTIQRAKEKQITTIIISHKPSILEITDKVLVLHEGEAKMFDESPKVLEKLSSKKIHKAEEMFVVA